MEKYQKDKRIGEGTYGVVYKAIVKGTNEVVAVKKIRMGKLQDGVSFTALREIKSLQEIHHPNIISLKDVFIHKKNVHLVFDFMSTDLEQVIKDKDIFLTPAHIKSYMKMMLEGLQACHKSWVLHRDLKPNNLLIGSDGVLKLADFGLSRAFGSPNPKMTHQVVTRWYRAPELLFGAKAYGYGVDMWAAGCIFAEMMLRTPYFAGDSEMDQLSKIFSALGTPTEEQWPGLSALPSYVPFHYCAATPFKVLFTAATDDAIDLLSKLLRYDPASRLTATEALNHPYFSHSPSPTHPSELPMPSVTRANAEDISIASQKDETQTHLGKRGIDSVSSETEEPAKMKRKLLNDCRI